MLLPVGCPETPPTAAVAHQRTSSGPTRACRRERASVRTDVLPREESSVIDIEVVPPVHIDDFGHKPFQVFPLLTPRQAALLEIRHLTRVPRILQVSRKTQQPFAVQWGEARVDRHHGVVRCALDCDGRAKRQFWDLGMSHVHAHWTTTGPEHACRVTLGPVMFDTWKTPSS